MAPGVCLDGLTTAASVTFNPALSRSRSFDPHPLQGAGPQGAFGARCTSRAIHRLWTTLWVLRARASQQRPQVAQFVEADNFCGGCRPVTPMVASNQNGPLPHRDACIPRTSWVRASAGPWAGPSVRRTRVGRAAPETSTFIRHVARSSIVHERSGARALRRLIDDEAVHHRSLTTRSGWSSTPTVAGSSWWTPRIRTRTRRGPRRGTTSTTRRKLSTGSPRGSSRSATSAKVGHVVERATRGADGLGVARWPRSQSRRTCPGRRVASSQV